MKYSATLFLLFSLNLLFSQKSNETYLTTIKIYASSWNSKYLIPRTIKNIKELHSYYFKSDANDLFPMFSDFEDCKEKLSKQKILPDSLHAIIINSLVEISFSKKKVIRIYFDMRGNFYYQDKWHKRNNELYYLLFKYFSNEIIPQKTLEECKAKYIDDLWHSE